MTKIKCCGLTRREDVLAAVHLGADALGFIFYPGSPRYVSPDDVAELTGDLAPFVSKVGVFVDASLSDIQAAVAKSMVTVVQLHGDEDPVFCSRLAMPVIKAIRVASAADVHRISDFVGKVSAILLDTKHPTQWGGTGQVFDWSLAVQAQSYGVPIILAGGLTPDNVRGAIDTVKPYAVDTSSGIESSPGIKEYSKLSAFIAMATERK